MAAHKIHGNHSHVHGTDCGHTAIRHGEHVDYLHDGCLHTPHGDHFDECRIEVSPEHPDACTAGQEAAAHGLVHQHGPGCGHEAVPHGGHLDYLVEGRLHHPHGEHCDDHGAIETL